MAEPPAEQAARVQLAVARLLDVGWGTSPDVRTPTDQRFRELDLQLRQNPQVLYAYALTLLKQRRYEEAGKWLDVTLQAAPDNVTAWRAKSWLATLSNDYSSALVAFDKLSQLISAESGPATSDEVDHWRYLGRMFAFLEGPVQDEVRQVQVRDTRRRVLERADDERRAAFEEGFQLVDERYRDFAQQQGEVAERAEERAEAEREAQRADLQEQRGQIEERAAAVRAEQQRTQRALQARLDELEQADEPLAQRAARMDASAATIQRELASLVGEIGRLQLLLDRETDPIHRARLRREIGRLDGLALRYDADLAVLSQQAAGVASQRGELRQQRQAAINQANQLTQKQNAELASLRQRERRLDVEKKRLERSRGSIPLRLRSLRARSGALTTYEPFPLEQQRQQLLDDLASVK